MSDSDAESKFSFSIMPGYQACGWTSQVISHSSQGDLDFASTHSLADTNIYFVQACYTCFVMFRLFVRI